MRITSCPLVRTWPTLVMIDDWTRPSIGALSVRWSSMASALASLCRSSSACRSAASSFSRLIGKERLHRLFRIARDDVEPGRRRGELSLLHGELGLLILQGFGRVDDGGFGARLGLDQLGAHVDALLQRRDQILLRRDGLRQHVALCEPSASSARRTKRPSPRAGPDPPPARAVRARAGSNRPPRARRSPETARRHGRGPPRAPRAAARSRPRRRRDRREPPWRRPPRRTGRARPERRRPSPRCRFRHEWRRPGPSRPVRSP